MVINTILKKDNLLRKKEKQNQKQILQVWSHKILFPQFCLVCPDIPLNRPILQVSGTLKTKACFLKVPQYYCIPIYRELEEKGYRMPVHVEGHHMGDTKQEVPIPSCQAEMASFTQKTLTLHQIPVHIKHIRIFVIRPPPWEE